jgi:glycosyltransferase involved in cell wall biosynthesis
VPKVGVVVIGRNEGARLERCLRSVVGKDAAVVYVDSGSSDDSIATARSLGAKVIELDLKTPFTAARARNAGFEHLSSDYPEIEFVQFVDGDCEVVAGWMECALEEMRAKPQAAIVCGRRRERFPDASIYNAMCDIEWDTPIGESAWCGGDAMMRAEALKQVKGYNASVIAGEEPELCFRLRQRGWKIYRIDAEMTLHDAAMTRFAQWWKRSVRAGHAYAELCAMHAHESPERYFAREVRSNWFWGIILPLIAIALAWPTRGWSLVLLLGYLLLAARVHSTIRNPKSAKAGYTFFTMLGKFPQAIGQAKFILDRRRGRRSTVIEYKRPSAEITKEPVA